MLEYCKFRVPLQSLKPVLESLFNKTAGDQADEYCKNDSYFEKHLGTAASRTF